MADPIIPATDLVLAALHAIRAEVQRTNVELQKTNAELQKTNAELQKTRTDLSAKIDETNERVDLLRVHTTKGLTQLNQKVDKNTLALGQVRSEIHELRGRFDHFLSGEGSRLVKRVTRLETDVRRLNAKLEH